MHEDRSGKETSAQSSVWRTGRCIGRAPPAATCIRPRRRSSQVLSRASRSNSSSSSRSRSRVDDRSSCPSIAPALDLCLSLATDVSTPPAFPLRAATRRGSRRNLGSRPSTSNAHYQANLSQNLAHPCRRRTPSSQAILCRQADRGDEMRAPPSATTVALLFDAPLATTNVRGDRGAGVVHACVRRGWPARPAGARAVY